MEELLRNLVNAYSAQDSTVRKTAESTVLGQISSNFPEMMGVFSQLLASPQQPDTVKRGVLTFLSRIFKDKSEVVQSSWINRVNSKVQQSIRGSLFAGLSSPSLSGMSLTCVIALAVLEMPRELWNKGHIQSLCDLCRAGNANGLNALGGICQDVNPSFVNPYTRTIAETLYAVLSSSGNNQDLTKCVLKTIGDALGALEVVLREDAVRDQIANRIVALLGCGVEDVVVAAFETLGCFVEHEYFYMGAYMQNIYTATERIFALANLDNNRSSAICAALEFWFAVADKECAVIADFAHTARGVDGFAPKYYARTVHGPLIQHLVKCLLLLEDDDATDLDLSDFAENTEYVPAVAHKCLERIFDCIYAEFTELNEQTHAMTLYNTLFAEVGRTINSGDWRQVAVSLWILEVIACLIPNEKVPALVPVVSTKLTNAPQPLICALSAQLLGVLVEENPDAMIQSPETARLTVQVITALVERLRLCNGTSEAARLTGVECCGALMRIIETYSYSNMEDPSRSPLAFQGLFEKIVKECMAATDEVVQPLAYRVISAFVSSDVLPPEFNQSLITFAETLIATIEQAQAGTPDNALEARMSCINACIRKGRLTSESTIKRLLRILNTTFANNTLPLTQESSLETVAALVDALESGFDPYAEEIKEGIAALALNMDEPGVARKAVDVISRMAYVNNPKLRSFAFFVGKIEQFFTISKSVFAPGQTQEVRSLGAPYIGLFSDFATYMEDAFLRYLPTIIELFSKYALAKVDQNDMDYNDFVYGIRLSISKFFLTAARKFIVTNKLGAQTQRYTSVIMKSLVDMNTDGNPPPELGDSALTIITTLASATGANFKTLLLPEYVNVGNIVNMVSQIITDARDSKNTKTVSIAQDTVNALRHAQIQI